MKSPRLTLSNFALTARKGFLFQESGANSFNASDSRDMNLLAVDWNIADLKRHE